MMAMAMGNCGMSDDPMMPDLSHLNEEERVIILQVLQRQKAEEQKEEEIAQKGDKELDEIERQINERKENAQKLVGTQDDAICQICQKTKFADGIGHKCFYCQLRSCARCGGKTTSKNKNIWACSLCQKRQQILARTGKWFQNPGSEPNTGNPNESPTPSQSSHGLGSNQGQSSSQLQQEFLDDPSVSGATHQRSVSDASAVSTAQRISETARKHSLKQRQTTLHRQSSLETDSQQGMNGVSDGNFANGGDGVHMPSFSAAEMPAVNNNHVGNNHQQQPVRKSSTRQHSSASYPINNGTPGKIQQHQQKPVEQEQHVRHQNKHPAVRQQAPSTSQQSAANNMRQMTGTTNQRPVDRSMVHKKSVDERQNVLRTDRHTGEQRKLRSSPRAAGATNEQCVRTSPNQNFVPSPLAVPPPDNPSTSTTTAIMGVHLSQKAGSPMMPARARRTKVSRQMRSLSSSEEEQNISSQLLSPGQQLLPSSSSLQNTSQQLQDQDFSEKDLLRYIYGAHNFTKNGRNGPSQFEALESGRSTGISAGGNILANKIRNYLSHDNVSWQPSADQRRLIGHMILTKPAEQPGASVDFGIKVIGGRHSTTGRLGTFVTKIKPGSVADIVGQLRPGDEVLEWNGNCLQNITNDAVYNIINASKNDVKLELIVSRSVSYPGNDDFLNINRITGLHRPISEASFYDSRGYIDPSTIGRSMSTAIPIGGTFSPYESARIPHSLSLVAAPLYKLSNAELHHGRAASPLVFHRAHSNYMEPALMATMQNPVSSAHICGRIEISLLYLIHKRELVVTLHRAYDLVPRQDGPPRNPYVKFFLLPDRSEKSRRQSAALAETLMPVWNESFYYYDLTEPLLMSRVLEVTVWDYDQYEANSFLGETLIDLSQTPLENQPFAYSLLDMDEENPIRLRLRQRRYSAQTPPVRSRSQTSHYNPAVVNVAKQYHNAEGEDYFDCSFSMQNLPHYSNFTSHRSRNSGRQGYYRGATNFADSDDWHKNSSSGSGYFSDHTQAHHYSQIHSRANHRRPRSATALRNVAEIEDSDQSYGGVGNHQSNSYIPPYEMDTLQQQRSDGMMEQRRVTSNNYNGKQKGRTRQEVLQEQANTEYGSDGGSETLSVNSAQSMQNRAINRSNQEQQQMSSMSVEDNDAGSGSSIRQSNHPQHQNTASTEDYALDEGITNNSGGGCVSGSMMQMGNGAKGGTAAAAALMAKQRKKSLMTRFIPGRNGSSEGNKRTGFARSEEVGVHEALSVPGESQLQTNTFTKQASKESTDSDNWLPVLPDRPLGSFVENLGPGQVVGRQVLASPVMGEIMVKLSLDPAIGIVLEVLEAKNLVARHGSKLSPAPYIKAYLLEGKNCIAKAKTQTSRKSTSSLAQQTMVFNVFDTNKKMLQISVLGDYGRMERKGFLGIAQINLDELDLNSQRVVGWYKLFHSNYTS